MESSTKRGVNILIHICFKAEILIAEVYLDKKIILPTLTVFTQKVSRTWLDCSKLQLISLF